MKAPVHLDLYDDRDIHVVVVALTDFALHSDTAARELEDRAVCAVSTEALDVAAAMQNLSDRAHVLLGQVEGQLG